MRDRRDPRSWMWTYTGKKYWPADPHPDDICIEDIAHGLSLLCRFAGQVNRFYSVAEHSVFVSLMVPPELALEGLLHDASEAYCCDVVRPLKQWLPDYRYYENLTDQAIRQRFHLPVLEHRLVKEADNNILHTEYRRLMRPLPEDAQIPGTFNPEIRLFLWPPEMAEIAFLNRYHALVKASGIRNS